MPGNSTVQTEQNYTLVKKLGSNPELGTTTYLARRNNGVEVILKRIKCKSESQRAEAEREIECLLTNDLLVQFDINKTPAPGPKFLKLQPSTTYSIVFNCISGQNIQQFVDSKAPLSGNEWISLLYHFTQGLLHFHQQGYAHRDVKPENFIINAQGVYAIDFGKSIRKDYADENPTLGTPDFASDESIPDENNQSKNNQLSDLSSLGYSFLNLLKYITTPTGRKTLDFKTKIPETIVEAGFTEPQKIVLIKIFQGLINLKPLERPSIESISIELAKIHEGELNLNWMNSKPDKDQTAPKEEMIINQEVIEIQSNKIDKLEFHGYVEKSSLALDSRPIHLEEFDKNLCELKNKQDIFKAKMDGIKNKTSTKYQRYKVAHVATNLLINKLESEERLFLKDPTEKNLNQFKLNCNQAIQDVRPTLESHRGVNHILANIALAIAGVGVVYIIACAVNKISGHQFSFFSQTSSSKLLKQLETSTQQVSAPAA